MLTIDGSQGEGGGQVLRTTLALAMCTGTPVRITNIRARRSKPGLMRQHLAAVQAAVDVSGGNVEGAAVGAQEIRFTPDRVRNGDYRFAIGTAGSTTLVLQTVLPALLTAPGPSRLVLEGGTHNPLAPPFDFLQRAFLPLLNRMGPQVEAVLERPGFYPAGGGRIVVRVQPVMHLQPLHIPERGAILAHRATAMVAGLPGHIAKRELAVVREKLGWNETDLHIQQLNTEYGPGNALTLEVAAKHVTEVFTAFGEKGVGAETVAERAIKEARSYLAAGVSIGEHLADQLQIPLALAGEGSFTTLRPTLHSLTNIEVIRHFLDVGITLWQVSDKVWRLSVA